MKYNMKCIVITTILIPLLWSCQSREIKTNSLEQQALTIQAENKVNLFASSLLATVQSNLQAGGAVQAIQACQLLAPELAKQASDEGWQVGRTSLKLRNQNNKPDEWEQQVLQEFAQAYQQGTAITQLKKSAIVAGQYRYIQAIEVKQPCLACHGQQIAPQVQTELQRLYPQDQAVGYSVGELRGAFTLKR